MGFLKSNKVLLCGSVGAFSPLDSTTYWYNNYQIYMTTASGAERMRLYVPLDMVIETWDHYYWAANAAGTQEDVNFYLRTNDTTDHTLTTAPFSATKYTLFTNRSLDIELAAGEFFNLKMVTPAWVTNPTNIYGTWVISARLI